MKFRRRLSPNANVNLVPMIDVVFQLIIFFMVSTTFIISPGIPVVLPSSSSSEQVAMTKIVVTVVSAEEIYLNRNKYSIDTLDKALSQITAGKDLESKGAIIEGDSHVSYSLMIRVLDVLRKNGYKVANLKTRPVVQGK